MLLLYLQLQENCIDNNYSDSISLSISIFIVVIVCSVMGGCLSTFFIYVILRQFCEVNCILKRKKRFQNEIDSTTAQSTSEKHCKAPVYEEMDSTTTQTTSEKHCKAPVYEEIHLSENVAYELPQKI